MLSMRTKLPHMRAHGLISFMALIPFSVLTTDQAWRATLGEQKTHTMLIRCGFCPSGIDLVNFGVDYNAVYHFEKFVDGAEYLTECDSIFWRNWGIPAANSGWNVAAWPAFGPPSAS